MNRSELVKAMVLKTQDQPAAVDKFLDALLEVIALSLVCEEDVLLSGFGKFEVRHRAEHAGVNPRTQEPTVVPARKVIAFRPAAALRKRMNSETNG